MIASKLEFIITRLTLPCAMSSRIDKTDVGAGDAGRADSVFSDLMTGVARLLSSVCAGSGLNFQIRSETQQQGAYFFEECDRNHPANTGQAVPYVGASFVGWHYGGLAG